MAFRSFTPNQTYPCARSLFYPTVVFTDVTTAAAVTYTAAQILGGLVLRDPNGGARADLMPTLTDLKAAIQDPTVGRAFQFTIRNTADAAETITLTTNTGATLSGTMTIAQNNQKTFLVVFTSTTSTVAGTPADGYRVFSMGTVVF
jgi:hypothetical protein